MYHLIWRHEPCSFGQSVCSIECCLKRSSHLKGQVTSTCKLPWDRFLIASAGAPKGFCFFIVNFLQLQLRTTSAYSAECVYPKSFLNTGATEIVNLKPIVMEDRNPFILHSQHHDCAWPGNVRNQGISKYGNDLVRLEYSDFRNRWLNGFVMAGQQSLPEHYYHCNF